MQRDGEDIAAIVEDLLRPVAMMVIDIQDGDTLGAAVAEGLGGDGGVVEEAVAAIEIAAGMMSGRAA